MKKLLGEALAKPFLIPEQYPWTNKWAPPGWATTHGDQGKAQGYIQWPKEKDPTEDTSGRHHHLLANALLRMKAGRLLGDLYESTEDTSPLDTYVNKLGRKLASKLAGVWGGVLRRFDRVPNGDALNRWIYGKLCDESGFNFAKEAMKGPLNDEVVRQGK
jgi:hypothetical protein